MNDFRAFRIHQDGGKIAARIDNITLDELPTAFDGYIKGAITGRTLVRI